MKKGDTIDIAKILQRGEAYKGGTLTMTLAQKLLFKLILQLDGEKTLEALKIISQMVPGEPLEPGGEEAIRASEREYERRRRVG
jgi:hypothetical protein